MTAAELAVMLQNPWLCGAALASAVQPLALGLVNMRRYAEAPALAEAAPVTRGRRVGVCVPARNEAANIEACVISLLAQTYPHLEVVVLDDPRCVAWMERMQRERADLWREDIGL